MANLLPGHRHSKSGIMTKVGDVANGIAQVKAGVDLGQFLYNAGRGAIALGRQALPYLAGAAALA